MSGTDEVDYKIQGTSTQYVEIELDPGESAVAEAGAMMYKDADIEMSSVLGVAWGQEGGFFGKRAGAGMRLISGECLF
ncbi:MAG: AIM24 family protein, partial [Alphaproteobacteria bacterium]